MHSAPITDWNLPLAPVITDAGVLLSAEDIAKIKREYVDNFACLYSFLNTYPVEEVAQVLSKDVDEAAQFIAAFRQWLEQTPQCQEQIASALYSWYERDRNAPTYGDAPDDDLSSYPSLDVIITNSLEKKQVHSGNHHVP